MLSQTLSLTNPEGNLMIKAKCPQEPCKNKISTDDTGILLNEVHQNY